MEKSQVTPCVPSLNKRHLHPRGGPPIGLTHGSNPDEYSMPSMRLNEDLFDFAAKLQFGATKMKIIRFRMTPKNNPPKSSKDPILKEDIPNGVVLVTLIGFFDWGLPRASVR